MSVFAEGRITPIIEKVGKDALLRDRYRPANFELLLWAPTNNAEQDFYINTVGSEYSYQPALSNDEQNGLEFGFMNAESILIESHLADGSRDSWDALHYVGAV